MHLTSTDLIKTVRPIQLAFIGLSLTGLSLIGCATKDGEKKVHYEKPRYATPGPAGRATMTWEVRCGFDSVIIPDQTFKQFYKEDGTMMTEEEFCASMGKP